MPSNSPKINKLELLLDPGSCPYCRVKYRVEPQICAIRIVSLSRGRDGWSAHGNGKFDYNGVCPQ